MRSLARLLCAVLLLLGSAFPVLAGPPWISVEYPSNPHHPSTRGASFLIRTYHHENSMDVPMRAVAEGIVKGARRSIPLEVLRTATPGLYAVRATLPEEGAWVVAVTLVQSEHSTATALVSLDAKGRVLTANVPSSTTRDGWVVPRAVTPADIEAELRVAARLAGEGTGSSRAGLGAAGLLVLGLAVAVRRRPSRR